MLYNTVKQTPRRGHKAYLVSFYLNWFCLTPFGTRHLSCCALFGSCLSFRFFLPLLCFWPCSRLEFSSSYPGLNPCLLQWKHGIWVTREIQAAAFSLIPLFSPCRNKTFKNYSSVIPENIDSILQMQMKSPQSTGMLKYASRWFQVCLYTIGLTLN